MTKQRLIQLIHIARNELGMDEDTYRQMLQGLTGKASNQRNGYHTTKLRAGIHEKERLSR
ncbi:Mu prophage; modulation of host gene protein [Escherichia coli]|uniref:Mu prophage modulation of host gene protein n=1 Tax=Escherichia coli TaxID=562 RepID=A0A376LLR9_ECOLX|nr:Mu prophage; modulation of host gene protein [Escherichia coli]